MANSQSMKPLITTFDALSLLVKAHQVKILAGIKNRFDNHLDEIQRFTIKHIMRSQESGLNSDTAFNFSASNVRRFVFDVVHEHGINSHICSSHVVTVVPSSSVYGFAVTAFGGGNRDLEGKPAYHRDLVAHFTQKLRAPMPDTWQEPDLHVPTFYTGPDESPDPLADVW